MPLIVVPNAGQTLGNSRPSVQNNFGNINTSFNVNHVDFGVADTGKHKWVTMPVQGASPATGASEVALFSRTSAFSAVPEMAFRRESNGTVIEFTSALQAATGWTRLPSGILMKWGVISGSFPNGTWQSYLFPTGATIPAFTAIYNVTLQSVTTDVPPVTTHTFNYLTVASVATTGFSWIPRTNFLNVNQQRVYYSAIGV